MSASRSSCLPTIESPDAAVWVVRGGSEGDTVMYNLNENVVTLGWGDWPAHTDDFESVDRDALDRIFKERFGDEHPASVRRRGRQEILRFRDRIRSGDLVVLPLKNHDTADAWVAIGQVTGPATPDPDRPKGARLRRDVTWLTKYVPESAAQRDLVSSIKRPRLRALADRW